MLNLVGWVAIFKRIMVVGTGGEEFYETTEISITIPHLSSKLSLNPDYAEPGFGGSTFYL